MGCWMARGIKTHQSSHDERLNTNCPASQSPQLVRSDDESLPVGQALQSSEPTAWLILPTGLLRWDERKNYCAGGFRWAF